MASFKAVMRLHSRPSDQLDQPMVRKQSGFDVLIEHVPRQHFDKGQVENTNSSNARELLFVKQIAASMVNGLRCGSVFVWGDQTPSFERRTWHTIVGA